MQQQANKQSVINSVSHNTAINLADNWINGGVADSDFYNHADCLDYLIQLAIPNHDRLSKRQKRHKRIAKRKKRSRYYKKQHSKKQHSKKQYGKRKGY